MRGSWTCRSLCFPRCVVDGFNINIAAVGYIAPALLAAAFWVETRTFLAPYLQNQWDA
jgi:hypothetical protein